MLRGEIPISHQALDERDAGQAMAYLHSWLVTHGRTIESLAAEGYLEQAGITADVPVEVGARGGVSCSRGW
jgi:hypothetical protein